MGCFSILWSVIYSFMTLFLRPFDLGNKLLGKYNPLTCYFSWQPSTAFSLFGYFLFLPAILSFLFSRLSLQRVCIQSTSSISQSLINLEKLPSCPILTVRYKNRHPERLQSAVCLWFKLKQFWYGNKKIPLTITSLNFNPQTALKGPFSHSHHHMWSTMTELRKNH